MKFIVSIKDENLKKTTYLFLDEEGRTAGCTYHEGNPVSYTHLTLPTNCT